MSTYPPPPHPERETEREALSHTGPSPQAPTYPTLKVVSVSGRGCRE